MLRYFLYAVAMVLVSALYAASPLDFERMLSSLQSQFGDQAFARGKAWQRALEHSRGAAHVEQLRTINNYFNQFKWASDQDVWGQEDYWATPLEFIGRGTGDCEDFAIAKYYSLIEVGFPAEKLRLMYVKAIDYDQHHMVLTYYPNRGAEPLVLDNIDPELKPAGERDDLLPIYSFNADFLWVVKARGAGQQVGKSDRLSLWRELQLRHAEQATE